MSRAINARQGRPQRQARHPFGLSNLDSFLAHTTPTVPMHSEFGDSASPPGPQRSWFSLQSLWSSYEAWGAYGAEVPVQLNIGGAWQEVIQCYVPYLSGLQLFEADPPSREQNAPPQPCPRGAESPAAGAECASPASRRSADGSSAASASSGCSTASTISTDSDSEESSFHKDPAAVADAGEAAGEGAGEGASTPLRGVQQPTRPAGRGSVLRPQRGLGEPARPVFEFFEAEGPHMRPPLSERVEELAAVCPALHELDTRALHPCSWYSVAWYPLYRIPSVADPAATRDLQAAFLTFHSLIAPPCVAASLHPAPPPFGAGAQLVLQYRAEAARQRLLASALSTVSLGAARGAAPQVDGRSAERRPGGAAGPASTAARLPPLNVASLQPFGFMPYRAVGATWADDFNLQRLHLPMLAAAGAWVERRGVRQPDFDFFSRAAQFHRPLPSMR